MTPGSVRTAHYASKASYSSKHLSALKRQLIFITLFVLSACAGDSCACGDIKPIAGGFPVADGVDNSLQLHVTKSGLNEVAKATPSIVDQLFPSGLDFEFPKTVDGGNEICTNGDCVAHIELRDVNIYGSAPDWLVAEIKMVLQTRNRAGESAFWGMKASGISCDVRADTTRGQRETITIGLPVAFEAEDDAARLGYTEPQIGTPSFIEGIENRFIGFEDDLTFKGVCVIAEVIEGLIINEIEKAVISQAKGFTGELFCQTHGETGCPTGTFSVPDASPSAICRFADSPGAECVSMLLGIDGEGDIGQAVLGTVSPGVHAYGQLLMAATGPAKVEDDAGMSLRMAGGMRSLDPSLSNYPGHHACVPVTQPPAKPIIQPAAAFDAESVSGVPPFDVSIGLAEDFMNYAAWQLFDSGALCLGIDGNISSQLSSGLFSLFLPSLADITAPDTSSPLRIDLRPQSAPSFTVGTANDGIEPLITMTWDTLRLDFSIWTHDRYLHLFSYHADLEVPIDLEVVDGQIEPQIGGVTVNNGAASNIQLLHETPKQIEDGIAAVIPLAFSMLGSTEPIALPSLFGLQLTVADGGIRGVDDAGDRFVGIFGGLSEVPDTAFAIIKSSEWVDDPAQPAIDVEVDGDEGAEFSMRVDGLAWSPWTADRNFRFAHPVLGVQADHKLELRARKLGSQLPTHAVDDTYVRVDRLAPYVDSRALADEKLRAFDNVARAAELQIKFDQNDWRPYEPEADLSAVRILKVRDSEGNTRRYDLEARRAMDLEVRRAMDLEARRATDQAPLSDLVGDGLFACALRAESLSGRGDSKLPLALWLLLFGLVVGRLSRVGALTKKTARARGVRAKKNTTDSRCRRKALFVAAFILVLGGCNCGGDPMPMVVGQPCEGRGARARPGNSRVTFDGCRCQWSSASSWVRRGRARSACGPGFDFWCLGSQH